MADIGTLAGGWARGVGALGTSIFNPEKGQQKINEWAQTYTPELADKARKFTTPVNPITEPTTTTTPTPPNIGSVGYAGSTPIDPNVAMQNIDLSSGVNGRQFEQVPMTPPLAQKGTPIVDDLKKVMNPDKSIKSAGQYLNVDEDDVVTKSTTKGLYKGDIIRGLDKDKKGYVMDYDYEMKPSSTKEAKETHPPSIFARDYKTFDAEPYR